MKLKFNIHSLLKLRFPKYKLLTLGLGLSAIHISSCARTGPPTLPTSSAIGESAADTSPAMTKSRRIMAPPSHLDASPIPRERPGLGTGWGNDVASTVNFTNFTRASVNPSSISSIYYNDKEGIKAMTNKWTYKGKGLQKAARGMVEWGVKSGWGYLDNIHSRGKRYVIGNKNQVYSLVVKNITTSRLELVMSVDGIDVLDGRPASTSKRGYIIQPGKTLTIKGFRKSSDAVAAFKFASVNNSYTNLTGSGTTNVGVIGMAVFTEEGIDPWKYSRSEIKRRNRARAFADPPQLRAR